MIYKSKEFILKNGLKIVLKTPDLSEASELLTFVMTITGQSRFLGSEPEEFKTYTVEKEKEFIASFQKNNDCLIAVYVDGNIVGDCNIICNYHKKDRHRCTIGIGIDEHFCNMGIGSLLLDEMILLASKMDGIEQVELVVNRSNDRARHLYSKKGFKETGVIPKAMKYTDGTYDDEIMMVKFL